MKTLIAAVMLLGAAMACPRLCADDESKDKGGRERLAERIQDLNLTEEQEAKIAEIMKESQPKVQEAGKELAAIVKEEVEKIHGVLTAEQRQKLEALKEERTEHRLDGLAARIAHLHDLDLSEAEVTRIQDVQKENRPKVVKAMEGLKGLLSDEQHKAREEGLKASKKRREILTSLNLTEDQKEKIGALSKEIGTNVREELGKIRDLLTEEQKAKLADLKDERRDRVRDRMAARIENFQDLNLTDEQKTKIANIREEYRPKIHEAGNKLRAAVREEVAGIVAVMKG